MRVAVALNVAVASFRPQDLDLLRGRVHVAGLHRPSCREPDVEWARMRISTDVHLLHERGVTGVEGRETVLPAQGLGMLSVAELLTGQHRPNRVEFTVLTQ